MIEDFLLRFAWIAKHFIKTQKALPDAINSSIFAFLEIFRRFVWNFFRLENEHLNNCGEFRAVRDISVAPLKEDDLTQLNNIMDERNFSNINRSKIKRE